jgi:hypothetical protein
MPLGTVKKGLSQEGNFELRFKEGKEPRSRGRAFQAERRANAKVLRRELAECAPADGAKADEVRELGGGTHRGVSEADMSKDSHQGSHSKLRDIRLGVGHMQDWEGGAQIRPMSSAAGASRGCCCFGIHRPEIQGLVPKPRCPLIQNRGLCADQGKI